MNKILSFLLLLLPIASFAEEAADGMTTIFEEHFDGWLYTHTLGMNATYEASNNDVRVQTFIVTDVKNNYPCLRLKNGYFKVTIDNNTGAHGNFILSFKNWSSNIIVGKGKNNSKVNINSDGTYTINVTEGTKQIILFFNTDASKTTYIDDIVIKAPTSSIRTTPSADLSFKLSEMSAGIGKTYNCPTLLNPHNLPVKWFSSNQAVATVDESGNITPHFIGTATIYAIFEGNDAFAYQTASYQLTTKREPLSNEVYYDGFADYIGSGGNGGDFKNNAYVGDYNFTEKFTADEAKGLSKGYQCLNVKSIYTINDLEKLGVKNGRLNFRCAPSSTKKVLTVTFNDNTVPEQTINMQFEQWSDISIPINSDSQLSSITFSGTSFFLDEISIISEDFVTIGSTGYATLYYSGRTLKVPTGITAYTMKVENGKIVRSRTYSEGETLPKATAVVLRGKPGKYDIDTSTDEGITDDNNQLKGTDTKTNTIGNDGDNFYLLANKDNEGVGFYWGAQNGAAFLNGEHKAYLAIPAIDIEGSTAKSHYVFTEDAATAISEVADNESKSASYTLDGRRYTQGFKGIVITNGRKTIKR